VITPPEFVRLPIGLAGYFWRRTAKGTTGCTLGKEGMDHNESIRKSARGHQVLERVHIKTTLNFDPVTVRQHNDQRASRFVLRWGLPGGQFHGHQSADRSRFSTLSLPACFFNRWVGQALTFDPLPRTKDAHLMPES
jgi:hypothetical protein